MLLYVLAALVVVGFFLYQHTRPGEKANPGCDLNKQSVVIPGPERIRRSALSPDKLISSVDESVKTLYDVWKKAATSYSSRACLGTHNFSESSPAYNWETYGQIAERAKNFASGLQELGIEAGQNSYVGVYSQNRAEWLITEQAANQCSMPLVPLYDTLGPDAVKFIVNKADIPVVVCDAPKMKLLIANLAECKTVQLVVKMGDVTPEEEKSFEGLNIKVHSFSDVERRGAASPRDPLPPKPDDIATVCFTSGTTGDPKGVMMTHINMVSDISAVIYQVEKSNMPKPLVGDGDVHISYLPLAHMFERQVVTWFMLMGGRIGFFRGNIKKLTEDILLLRPTIFPSVPRLLNRVYDKVVGRVTAKGGITKKLFDMALKAKKAELDNHIVRNNSIWDLLVFRKVQKALGGRVKLIVTGAAPISAECLTFLRCAFGCPVLEGYGQTECAAACTLTAHGASAPGNVGTPLVCNEIKLDSVPEMNYFAEEDKGEVCIRGPNVMRGYLKNPDKTAETVDKDGWLHTGDIATWLPDGTLKIIDRKKSIFKLQQGEYVAPEKIENIIVRAEPIGQVFVYGSSLESQLVAVATPDEDNFLSWVKKTLPDVKESDVDSLCGNKAVAKAVLQEMLTHAKDSKLHRFEQPAILRLCPKPFTVEDGLLTPTFKAKRPQLQKAFQDDIDMMYAELKK